MPDQPDPEATGDYRLDLPRSPSVDRFAPGTLLAGRYRVIAPLLDVAAKKEKDGRRGQRPVRSVVITPAT